MKLCLSLSALCLCGLLACGDSGDGGAGGSGGAGGDGAGGVGAGSEGAGGAGGQGAGGEGGVARPGSLAADYCAPLAAFVCEQAGQCDCGSVLPGGALEVEACTDAYTARCLQAYAQVEQAAAAGAITIDGEKAAACVASIASATPSCERPRGTLPLGLCDAWFYGLEPLGARCSFPICASGAGYCLEGTCVERPGDGDLCSGYECQPGLLCIEGGCAPPRLAGEGCALDDACTPPLRCVEGSCTALGEIGAGCNDTTACAHGLRCIDDACAAAAPPPCQDDESCGHQAACANVPVCLPRVGEGAPCDGAEACDEGLYCSDVSVCALLPGVGQDCANGVLCAPGLGCTTDNGVCITAPGEGQACAFSQTGPAVCAAGLGCDSLTNQCAALPGEGELCTVDNRCGGDLGCDFTANGSICVVRKQAGGECQNDAVCAADLHCDYAVGTCAEDYPLGQACVAGNECGPDAQCLPSASGQFACSAAPAVGEPCAFECPSSEHYCGTQPANAICLSAICGEL